MAVGKKANIAIIDLNEEYTITRDNIYSKAKNTPFLDTKCFGLVKSSYFRWKNRKIIGGIYELSRVNGNYKN